MKQAPVSSGKEQSTTGTGNELTLSQLAQIEEAAHRSQTCEANTVLRLAAALREALQAKENACALAAEYKKQVVSGKRNNKNFRLGAGRAEGS